MGRFMASKHRATKARAATAGASVPVLSNRAVYIGFAAAVLLFYFKPLFDSAASIQWDAVDYHFSTQKYFSDTLHLGKLPFWTPYVFSGVPFLSDPQLGAWYPLNWPFFLIGITPRTVEWELALHALLASIGGYLLGRDVLRSRAAAVFAGVFFAFSGLFTETSSHTGPFQATSILPWLLWTGRRAAHSGRWLPAVTLTAGCLVLVGHFQTALYSFFALALYLAADFAVLRHSLRQTLLALVCAAAGAVSFSAVMVFPGLELTAQSIRSGADYSRSAGAALVPGALATLVDPNHYGALDPERYTGPQDITQFYLYMGILLSPLVFLGLAAARERWYALALIVPGAWYAFGPPAGLYSVVAMLPGFHSVRAPIQMWFVAALGLALLAAAGVQVVRARFRSPWIPLALLAVTGADLYHWNMDRNGLAYARESFQDRYGSAQDRFRSVAAPITANPMHRLWAPFASPSFGPLDGSLDNRMEVTFGYNPLQIARYAQYMEAAKANPRLLDGLAVTARLNLNGMFEMNQAALPRIYAPDTVTAVHTREEASARLATLDPAREAVAEGVPAIAQNGGVKVRIMNYGGDFYRARYQSDHLALLRIAVPYFPGWHAEVDGHSLSVIPVDVALMGVVAPAGGHELTLRYRSTWFLTGALVSGLAGLAVLTWLVRGFKGRRGGSVS